MTDELESWITTSEAARRLDVTSRWITQLIHSGQLTGKKINPQVYLVDAASVEAYQAKKSEKSSITR